MGIVHHVYKKDLNFIPERVITAAQRRRHNYITVLVLVLVASVMFSVYRAPEIMIKSYQSQINSLNREISQLEKAEPLYNEVKQTKQEYNAKKAALQRIKLEDKNFIDVLDKISLSLPTGVYISSLKYETNESLELKLLIYDPVDIARVMVALRKTNLFKKVSLQGKDVPLVFSDEPFTFNLTLQGATTKNGQDGADAGESEGEKNAADIIKEQVKDKINLEVE